jgi:deoxyxylulose-5-phosphate synthase
LPYRLIGRTLEAEPTREVTMHAPAALHLEETHPMDAGLAVATLAFGVAGLLLVVADANLAGAVVGAIGVLTGLWGQLISKTRPERFLDVIGIGAAAVAFAVGMAYAGINFSG